MWGWRMRRRGLCYVGGDRARGTARQVGRLEGAQERHVTLGHESLVFHLRMDQRLGDRRWDRRRRRWRGDGRRDRWRGVERRRRRWRWRWQDGRRGAPKLRW